ncbi:MAG: ATP-binding cassette domain-containing protein [Polyangia bacterium]
MMHNQAPVEVRGLVARYGDKTILDGVDFVAAPGEITVILGGSGCGKSTLLRHTLGLETPTAGSIRLLGTEIRNVDERRLEEIRTRIGVLFQSGALFTSMTVGENVAIVIRENTDLPEPIVEQMVRMKLALVGLEDAIGKYPEELSGGMRKRAAIARSIASDPDVLFCDEPSAGLDPVVATELDDLLLNLKKLFDMTLVVVTHELESIKKIADRAFMLDDMSVIAHGTLQEVMHSADARVREFFDRAPRAQERRRASLFSISQSGSQ